jgi:hypothetical protein
MKQAERILITVRTYPAISTKYIETVCTGGITDAGEWRRLYPVPLRYLEGDQQYRTFDVVSVQVDPGKDGRPETRIPRLPSLRVMSHLDDWTSRCQWINPTIHPSMKAMIAAEKSLAPVAVRRVMEFIANPTSGEWTPQQKAKLMQDQLFEDRKELEKIPFDFRFRWEDEDGEEHDSHVLAWEFGETLRQYRRAYSDPVEKMREKWMTDLCGPGRTVSFFMGNQARFRDKFSVCGIFAPPKEAAAVGQTLWDGHGRTTQ